MDVAVQRVNETRLRVRYAETDQMGVVYHANYIIWMEVGRVELCRALGLRYRDLERNEQVHLAVVEVDCRFARPALYDDEVIVKAWIAEANPRLVKFGYEMRNAETDVVLATGHTKHAFLGADMKPRKLPVAHRGIFGIKESSL
ncbi:MAG: acyl-CoA thioesterase [Bryobacterales bacterium]|nr:acyl-CoA thioesterase [Bryobacterales bacterium]